MVRPAIQQGNSRLNAADHYLHIARELLDPKELINVENLLDAFIAIYHDCNLPILKRIRSVDQFLQKYAPVIDSLQKRRMKDTDFEMLKVIGRGAYGEVQLVRNSKNKQVYAMKRLEKGEMIRRYDSVFFWEERDIMAHANSEWIVQLHYAFQDARYLYMVMEFMPGGDLVNLISRYDINEDWARFYLAELVLALDAIHTFGYIHRDVKPDNMLLSRSGHVKLADFGTCVKLGPDGKIKCATATGTPDYISPEVLNSQCSESVYGKEVDYWSVGIILYEMLVGEAPFYADTLMKTYHRIRNFATEFKYPDDVEISDLAKDLISKLLSGADVRLGRSGAAEVQRHPWFKNEKWTFQTIRDADPPFVPQLSSDDDTSNFEDVSPSSQNNLDNFQLPKAFNGNQLPFIGFTYSNELSPALAIHSMITSGSSDVVAGTKNGSAKSGNESADAMEKQRELEKRLDSSEQKVVEQQQELEEKTLELFAIQKELSRQDDEKRVQSDRLVKAESKLVDIQRQLEETTNLLRTEKQENAASKEHYEEDKRSLQSVLQQKEAQLAELKMKLDEQITLLKAERQEQAENLRREQVGSTSGLDARMSKMAEELEQQRQAEERTRSELWTLREDKQALENNLQNLQRERARLENRFSTLKEEYASEQAVANMFKVELEQARSDLTDKVRQLAALNGNLTSLQTLQDKLHNEHIARKIAEHSLAGIDKEKCMLQQELDQLVVRHSMEVEQKNNKIMELQQREVEREDHMRKILEENSRLKHTHRSASGPIHQSERSVDSISNNSGSQASLMRDPLENMTREELIMRCRREIQLKEQVVSKLYVVGQTRGIAEGPQQSNSKTRKQRNELKRHEELWAMKHKEEMDGFRKSIKDMEQQIHFLNEQLYEEQQKKDQLQNRLKEITQATNVDNGDRRVLQNLRHMFNR